MIAIVIEVNEYNDIIVIISDNNKLSWSVWITFVIDVMEPFAYWLFLWSSSVFAVDDESHFSVCIALEPSLLER